MTTAVCFDLDGTLVQYERPFPEFLRDALGDHLGTASDDLLDAYGEAFFGAFDALDPDPFETGMRAVLDVAATDGLEASDAETEGVDPAAMVDALREREFANVSVPEATRDCVESLAADDEVRLAVVTDGVGDWQRAKLERAGLREHFDEVVVSYDAGGHKADGDPYDVVRERIDADEYVMVGDSYESDVEAAREAGFVPIHYEDHENDLFAVLRAML